MRIAVLALQGAFAEHQQMLQKLGVESFLIRNIADWNKQKDGLIIPGGESTAMMKIMSDEGLQEPIRQAILDGIPTFGTCAGMILLDDQHLKCMDMTVRRNAYGRQLGSFQTLHYFKGITDISPFESKNLPMTFIRAPYIERCGKNVEVLSVFNEHVIAARQDKILVCSFHPELTNDTRVHQFFLSMIKG